MEELLIQELQMLTGKITNDIDYLVYQLLKGGSYFDEQSEKGKSISSDGVLDWVKTLEEVV